MSDIKQNPTIKDIAKLARVSVGTVSNYLNKTVPVSDKKSQLIEAAIRELGYQPNIAARNLRLQHTQTLGVIVPDISNPFFSEIANLITQYAWESEFQILLCNSSDDEVRQIAQLQTLYQRQVDGVLMIHSGGREIGEVAKQSTTPTIFIDRHIKGSHSIVTDNEMGGRLSMSHLVELGHRKIAIISGNKHIENVQERLAGAYQVLQDHGIVTPDEYVIHGDQSLETGLKADYFWQLPEPPTAIFTTNDVIALGVWQSYLKEHGAFSDEVSIIGFDNIQWSALLIPPLTTIAQPIDKICRLAIDTIVSVIHGKQSIQDQIEYIEPELIIRGSTRRIAS
jgi:LacI family transcriptional regulator